MNQATFIAGVDIGRSTTKVAYQYGERAGDFIFPSNVSQAVKIAHDETAKAAEKETVEVNGVSYFVGITAQQQSGSNTLVGLSEDWIEKPEYLALVKAAVRKIQDEVKTEAVPRLVIGTPSETYATHKEKIRELTQQVVSTEIKVLPQPSGAYFDYIFNDKGEPILSKAVDQETKQPLSWGVVELGHHTSDFLMIINGRVRESSFASTVGVGTSLPTLTSTLRDELQVKTTENALIKGLETGTLKHYNQNIDITKQIKTAMASIIDKVFSKSEEVFDRDASILDGIIIAGGGASYVYDTLRSKWPHVIAAKNPRMSIAHGFKKYGLSQQ